MYHAPLHLELLAALLALAAAWDVASRRIPNALCLAIAVAGGAAQVGRGGLPAILSGGTCAAAVLLPLAFGWRRGWLGGGDAKLFAAAATWMSWALLPRFLLATCVAGGVVSALALAGNACRRRFPLAGATVAGSGGRAHELLRVPVPYGVAITLGALTTLVRMAA